MLIALLSDIHANLEALEACLRHARSRGAERYALLGDFVGYGADATAVVSVIERYASEGAIVLKGNHDQAIDKPTSWFNDAARASLAWARETLSPEQKRFLAELPLLHRDGETCYAHASAAAPERWEYVDSPTAARKCAAAAEASYTFCGHVHVPALFHLSAAGKVAGFDPVADVAVPLTPQRRWIAVIGAVGQPRDRNPAACYALYDDSARTLTYVRVPYDIETAQRKIRDAGLPPFLSARLAWGR